MEIASIKTGLETNIIGKRIICLECIDSTNSFACEVLAKDNQDGIVILSEEQTRGKGRFGRRWFSPKGKCILCSVILRKVPSYEHSPYITIIGTLSVVSAITSITGLSPLVKFPNDIVINGRKVAGVLVESKNWADSSPIFVLGIGVNVNIKKEDFPRTIHHTATSLYIESGETINRAVFTRRMLESLDHWYERIISSDFDSINSMWKEYSIMLNKRVKITLTLGEFCGKVIDLDPASGVVMRLDTGHIRHFKSEHVKAIELLPTLV
jgi:BirA family biotin operon repressor/biotin-[acetyl-CoA-carboxylase] ligase